MDNVYLPDYDDVVQPVPHKKVKIHVPLTQEAIDDLLKTESDDSDSENDMDDIGDRTDDNLPQNTEVEDMTTREHSITVNIPTRVSSAEAQPAFFSEDRSDNKTRTEIRDRNAETERLSVIQGRQMTAASSRLRESIDVKLEPTLKTEGQVWSWPTTWTRVYAVAALLARPDIVINATTRMDSLKNHWRPVITKIRQRLRKGYPVTALESQLSDQHGSFMFADMLRPHQSYLMARSYRVQAPCTELIQPGNVNRTQGFYNPEVYGPSIPDRMTDDRTWSTNLKAVVAGCIDLYYLPRELYGQFLNLADRCPHPYFVPNTAMEAETVMATADSLYQRLQRIIHFLGSGVTLPLFVEFYLDAHNLGKPLLWHLVGFCQTLKACQRDYSGPLILLLGPVRPTSGGEESYRLLKMGMYRSQNIARLVGKAMGVAVAQMPLQQLETYRGQEWIKFHFWKSAAIYTTEGTPTQEMYRRIKYYLESCLPYVSSTQDAIKKESASNSVAEYVESR